ncbi:MAG: hypothetical protein U0263_39785 [Polyangiaceae bacterium]
MDSLPQQHEPARAWLGARYTLLYLAAAPGMRYTNDPSSGGQLARALG